MNKQDNPAIGGDAIEFMHSLLSPEEIAASDRRVDIMHRYTQGQETCFQALCDYLPEIDADPMVQKAVKVRLRESMFEGKGLPDIEDLVPMCTRERRRRKIRTFCGKFFSSK